MSWDPLVIDIRLHTLPSPKRSVACDPQEHPCLWWLLRQKMMIYLPLLDLQPHTSAKVNCWSLCPTPTNSCKVSLGTQRSSGSITFKYGFLKRTKRESLAISFCQVTFMRMAQCSFPCVSMFYIQKTPLVRYLQILRPHWVQLYGLRPIALIQRLPLQYSRCIPKMHPCGKCREDAGNAKRIPVMPPDDMVVLCYHKPAVFVVSGDQSHYLSKSIISASCFSTIITFLWGSREGFSIVLLAAANLQCKSICLPQVCLKNCCIRSSLENVNFIFYLRKTGIFHWYQGSC